eukprot:scaffold36516_cov180-Isochrysis_galbana.AAC.1
MGEELSGGPNAGNRSGSRGRSPFGTGRGISPNKIAASGRRVWGRRSGGAHPPSGPRRVVALNLLYWGVAGHGVCFGRGRGYFGRGRGLHQPELARPHGAERTLGRHLVPLTGDAAQLRHAVGIHQRLQAAQEHAEVLAGRARLVCEAEVFACTDPHAPARLVFLNEAEWAIVDRRAAHQAVVRVEVALGVTDAQPLRR